MMYVDNPVLKEILWEWRAFAIKFDPNICRNILNLPLKDGKSTNMLDRYICRLGYDTNIKIRDKDLKLKNLHASHHKAHTTPSKVSTTVVVHHKAHTVSTGKISVHQVA